MMENRQTPCQNAYRKQKCEAFSSRKENSREYENSYSTGGNYSNNNTNNNNMRTNNNVPSRRELMQRVNQYSFAVIEATLFLDTHPYDTDAMNYFQKYRALRQEALQDYAKYYAPLLVDYAISENTPWSWANEPWPWEGVEC